jgi:hypothetical protein
VKLNWHLAEGCRATSVHSQAVDVELPEGTLQMVFDSGARVELFHGCEAPMAGWMSRGYHHKTAITSLAVRYAVNGSRTILSRFVFDQPTPPSYALEESLESLGAASLRTLRTGATP